MLKRVKFNGFFKAGAISLSQYGYDFMGNKKDIFREIF